MSRFTTLPGPALLRAPRPDLLTHRATHGSLPTLSVDALLGVVDSARVRGRGGAGFPFATKLRTAATQRGRKHLVVNLSEGEPASLKDLALALSAPHLVLDGASVTAQAMGVRTIHLVLPEEHPEARAAIERGLAERRGLDREARLRWEIHLAAPRFISGESSAVTELVQGRPGLPVTTWQPTAVSGVRGAPTLLSNAETFAHVAVLVLPGGAGYADLGTAEEPGTRLLTVGVGSPGARVVEVQLGTPWTSVLSEDEVAAPVLLGGYHGTWAAAGLLSGGHVSAVELRGLGLTIGAGVVLPLAPGRCPLEQTSRILSYLARESAGSCGPCFNGLPALAGAFAQAIEGGGIQGVERMAGLVEGRGACAHPDGTARLARSALTAFPEELAAHALGGCSAAYWPEHVR